MEVEFLDPAKKVAVLSKSGAIVTQASYSPDAPYNSINGEGAEYISFASLTGRGLNEVAPWGNNNLKPLWLLQLLCESHINAQLIYTKVSLAVKDLYCFKWELRPDPVTNLPVPTKVAVDPGPEIRAILRTKKMKRLIRSRATDFFITGNTFLKIYLSRDASSISKMEHVDASYVRAEKERVGKNGINNYYVCKDWRSPYWKANEKDADSADPFHRDVNVRRYPAFDEDNPMRFYQSILHSRMYWTGEAYYGVQPWHFSYNWIAYGNKMPIWLSANINRAWNIKYHIQYPDDYFDYLDEMDLDPKGKEAAKTKFFQELDKALSGSENAMKAIKTPVKLDRLEGKYAVGWEIKPLPNDLKDEAFIKAFFASQISATSSHGVDPALAAIQMEGRMPISGSDKRISYQLHEVLKNDEVREIMVEPLELLRDTKGWDPELEFGFIGRNIVTLAEDKTGQSKPQLM
jgi:hypothetical protein